MVLYFLKKEHLRKEPLFLPVNPNILHSICFFFVTQFLKPHFVLLLWFPYSNSFQFIIIVGNFSETIFVRKIKFVIIQFILFHLLRFHYSHEKPPQVIKFIRFSSQFPLGLISFRISNVFCFVYYMKHKY